MTKTFLAEIGTEELPPKALKKLAVAFKDNVEQELIQAGLAFDTVEWFASPRRLAVKVLGLVEAQPSKEVEKRGLRLRQRLTRRASQPKRQRAGREAVVSAWIKRSVW